MNSAALNLLNSLDARNVDRMNRVASSDAEVSLGSAVEMSIEMQLEQIQLATVVHAAAATLENRQIAQGNFVDQVV